MAEGAAAEVVDAGTGGAPEGGSPPAGAPPSGAPTGGGSPTGEQPPAPGGEPGAAAPAPAPTAPKGPPSFPWSEYRKQQAALSRAEQERDRLAQEHQRFQQERAQWQAERTSLAEKAQNYEALDRMIQRDPQFADELERRLRGEVSTPRAARAEAALPPGFLDEWKEMRAQTRELHTAFQSERQMREQAEQQAALQRTDSSLNESLSGLLRSNKYPDAMLPQARAYVLQRVREIGDAKLEEVPYLFAEWHNAQEQMFNERMASFTRGAQAQQGLPVSPGTGATAPITQTPDLRDPAKAAKFLEEKLRGAGWQG